MAAFGALPSGSQANPPQQVLNQGQPVSSPHTYNAVNSNNTYIAGAGAPASLFSHMSAGLAPAVPGQVGPTLEQLLDRRSREWKPYRNASEFKEALEDWYGHILRTYPADATRLKAAHEYVGETCSIMERVGWQKAYEYHKAAFKAASKVPPQYDPLSSGPIYHFGYITLIHPHLTSGGGRSSFTRLSTNTGTKPRGPQRSTNAGTKRPSDSSSQCSIHPTAPHTNGDCRSQQANKRRASGGNNPSRPSSGESDA
jgi:hypothetical protein